jgi:REP element-mobilizing transposase RayT
MQNHAHLLLSVPPKHAVAQVVGYIKGKIVIQMARGYAGRRGTSSGSTSGRGDIGCRRSDETRPACYAASKSWRKKASASNNCNSRRFARRTITPSWF